MSPMGTRSLHVGRWLNTFELSGFAYTGACTVLLTRAKTCSTRLLPRGCLSAHM